MTVRCGPMTSGTVAGRLFMSPKQPIGQQSGGQPSDGQPLCQQQPIGQPSGEQPLCQQQPIGQLSGGQPLCQQQPIAQQTIGLVLGSASPRRENLLRQIGAHFEILAANADESFDKCAPPHIYVTELSLRKAQAVSDAIKSGSLFRKKYKRVIIIGADTIVVARDGGIIGKPVDAADAKRMLNALSGAWHEVYTGVAIITVDLQEPDATALVKAASDAAADTADTVALAAAAAPDTSAAAAMVEYEKTRVKMCNIGDDEIERYISTGEPFGKAGAYAIQGAGELFIERIDGCYSNVVGLPLRLLRKMLAAAGYDLLDMIHC